MSDLNLIIREVEHAIRDILVSDKPVDIVDDEVWPAIEAYFQENSLTAHQIHAFDNAVYEGFDRIIEPYKHQVITVLDRTYTIDFGSLLFIPPTFTDSDSTSRKIFPKECEEREITYASHIYTNVSVTLPCGTVSRYEKTHIAWIPVMVGSGLCNLTRWTPSSKELGATREELEKFSLQEIKLARKGEDIFNPGGYFILNGTRKVVNCQERSAYNRIYLFANRKAAPKFELYAEIRSCPKEGSRSTVAVAGILKGKLGYIIPWIENIIIPLRVLFLALGAKSVRSIVRIILGSSDEEAFNTPVLRGAWEILLETLESNFEIKTRRDALLYIGQRRKKNVRFSDEEDDDYEEILKEGAKSEKDKPGKALIGEEDEAISYATKLLETEFLPHLGQAPEHTKKKLYFMGAMTQELLRCRMGEIPTTDRDHLKVKRGIVSASLMIQQFYAGFRKLINEIILSTKKAVQQNTMISIQSWIHPYVIGNMMNAAIANDNWNAKAGGPAQGISQLYEQLNYVGGLSNLRKSSVPVSKDGGKIIAPRNLHGSHYGIFCASESPEGRKAGLLHNLALLAGISISTDATPLIQILYQLGCTPISTLLEEEDFMTNAYFHTRIMVNGDWIGSVKTPQIFVSKIRALRRSGRIDFQVSIGFNPKMNVVEISTEGGRFIRPLLIVEGGALAFDLQTVEKLKTGEITWRGLLNTGKVELLDKFEEEFAYIAMFPSDLYDQSKSPERYTHCELHPSALFGIGGSIIPYPDHNQAPRNAYQCGMAKQAIGMPYTNGFNLFAKGKFHFMHYLQKPLELSEAGRMIKFDRLPAGQNAIAAITPHIYNQEDSVEINQDSVDRGFGVSSEQIVFTLEARADKYEEFEIPSAEECCPKGNVNKLDDDAVVAPGTRVENGDILIGMTCKFPGDDGKKTDCSVIYNQELPGVVWKVQRAISGGGYPCVRIIVIQKRIPMVGDKFAARHGQKGTCSAFWRAVDLPFCPRLKCTPDIIVNSLAIPSRMTIGMLIECISGKLLTSDHVLNRVRAKEFCSALSKGEKLGCRRQIRVYDSPDIHNATPFRKVDLEEIRSSFSSCGIDGFGDEVLYDGRRGHNLRALIFTGPVYYQRLKHMVVDKFHARARGAKTTLTRQPKAGRKENGGLRYGVMERDCCLGQGAAAFTRDRMMENSDEFKMWVCDICGLIAAVDKNGKGECAVCQTNTLTKIPIPYMTKLVLQELMGMCIVPRIMNTNTSKYFVTPLDSGANKPLLIQKGLGEVRERF